MYSALEVAQYILFCAAKNGEIVSNLKLQKLLYFVQAEALVSTGFPLFQDSIYAVDYGIRIDAVYKKYLVYGASMIPFLDCDAEKAKDCIPEIKDRKLIESIVDATSQYSSVDLNHIIFKQTPWILAYRNSTNHIVTKKALLDFFLERKDTTAC